MGVLVDKGPVENISRIAFFLTGVHIFVMMCLWIGYAANRASGLIKSAMWVVFELIL